MNRASVQATTTFYQAAPGLRASRLALGLAERVWPALAVRAALRLFCTPLPPRWLQRQPVWESSWRIERWPFESSGLTVYTPGPAPLGAGAAPVVLLVHGWGGSAAQMRPLAQALTQHGLQPVLVDMPAHGHSAGRVSNLPQFARAIEYVAARLEQQGGRLHAVVAHSLGANAAAYTAGRGLSAQRLVLLAPPASPREYTRLFAHVFGLSERLRARLQARIESREGVLMAQFEPEAAGPRIGARALVVHDRGDRVNPFADGEAFAARIAHAQLLATDGLGHRKLLNDPAVLAAVTDFLNPSLET
ncbi:MAG TPA: alpha/beta fold hydrolase [Ramlibacter sp.]|jgi:pimeloyl-ACP methyl ester carboxylesterase|uniref:alpha/beta hydrolase n=1 Tax=Ramlibacter sp. TaxID=1917967 RepID=UPI002D27DB57|nr:alpha/beta fold hydrolase [Ramlibacter sp.]HZY17387.1 alpha/beta fold hydrolase [Ramlibacter sp.]